MADRSIGLGNTLNEFKTELNGTAADVGDISDLLSASSYIASATDVVEAIVLLNAQLPEIKQDSFIFPGRVMTFEGATDDAFETAITFTEPTADRTHTLPDGDGLILLEGSTETSTNKTLTTPTITSPVLNTGVSGTAVLDEDNMASDSATKVATQQSIKAYVDSQITAEDLDFAADSGSSSVDLDSQTFTIAGGSQITSSASGQAVTLTIGSDPATLTGSETLTNKTFTTGTTLDALTFASGTSTSGMQIGGTGIVFEGATADAYETTLNIAEPSQDNVITIPDTSMTLLTTATHASKFTHIVRCIALG